MAHKLNKCLHFLANQQPCWTQGKCMDDGFSGKILLRPGYEMTNSKCLDTCAIYGEEVYTENYSVFKGPLK